MSFEKISKGKILIAEPFMVDPNFKRSVILMCEHEEDGSLGFILNKSLDMKVNVMNENKAILIIVALVMVVNVSLKFISINKSNDQLTNITVNYGIMEISVDECI